MGMFAEMAIADYPLLFADQGKTNFRLQQKDRGFRFPLSVCSKETKVAFFC
jgi:hypothetical protein